MSYVLALALIVVFHAAKRAYDAHQALALEVLALQLEHCESWLRVQRQLAAEERVWEQSIDVHRTARRAMHAAASGSEREAVWAADHDMRPPRLVVRATSWPGRVSHTSSDAVRDADHPTRRR